MEAMQDQGLLQGLVRPKGSLSLSGITRLLLRSRAVWMNAGPGDLLDLWPEHIGPMGDFLIHTTRYPVAILNSNRIRTPAVGHQYVSLTRSPIFAEYWADVSRPDDEGMAAHLILDKSKLRHRYKIEPFRDPWNVSDDLTGKHRYEPEERIARDIFPLFDVLYGVLMVCSHGR